MNEPQNTERVANPTVTPGYVAVTHEQNPLTGGSYAYNKDNRQKCYGRGACRLVLPV